MSYFRGVGMYPGDACYDPTRPSWLPYWLDDLTESDCKWGSSNIVGATGTALANPDVVAQNVGGVIGQGAGAAVSDVAGGAGAAVQGALETLTPGGSFLVIAAAVLGGLVLVEMLKK